MQPIEKQVSAQQRHWLVTGSAGFIGSHLIEALLRLGQRVTSLDNFSTGHQHNLDEVRTRVGAEAWQRHRFIQGDIVDLATCRQACAQVDIVLHEAALGSVPRSIDDPLLTHASNVTGFLTLLVAAKEAKVGRFVYAASSSTYGDSAALPKVEDVIGRPLSPYAVTKYADELYADVFARCYGLATIGLRYFNVFGARQDPLGAYAAVIPIWARSMLDGRPCVINGDGETSRDFCYIDNVVQANLRAGLVTSPAAVGQVYNIALGNRTTLKELHALLASGIRSFEPAIEIAAPSHGPSRAGDIRHSLADISKAVELLGYRPTHTVEQGIVQAAQWYVQRLRDIA
jgi:UDP-N-acetylglucosamine 4-epimerase